MRLHLVIALVIAACSLSSALRDKIFVLQSPKSAGEKMVVVTWSEENGGETALECVIFTDKRLIEEVMKESKDHEMRKPSVEEMEKLLEECTTFSIRRRKRALTENPENSTAEIESIEESTNIPVDSIMENESTDIPSDVDLAEGGTEGYSGWNVIFPGTKWCGAGDIAKTYDDLGFHEDTDRCCRAHDHCDDLMAPGETRNNLTNTSPFTKLSCKCDLDFYDCLSRVNSVTSNTIGNMYFNLLHRSCYSKERPLTNKCKKYRTILKLKCKEYKRDSTAPEIYQWIPAKKYKRLPVPGPLTITLPF